MQVVLLKQLRPCKILLIIVSIGSTESAEIPAKCAAKMIGIKQCVLFANVQG